MKKWHMFIMIFFTVTLLCGQAQAKRPIVIKEKNTDEYSGRHNAKNIRMSVASKAFSWLSGSPADNEKLSIGKSAQFFGFVALRYQSGRAARRGDLGRAFDQLATESQREAVLMAAQNEIPVMEKWWAVRNQILRKLEHHLYTGEAIDETQLFTLGETFGLYNAQAGLIQAQACAFIESTLTEVQINTLKVLRADPTKASQGRKVKKLKNLDVSVKNKEVEARYEDTFAKCFTYLTGEFRDREVMPLGQPAQFFGFVSIRHKSGRGAKRGKISKQFDSILTSDQRTYLQKATNALLPEIKHFKALRRQLMQEMDLIRTGNSSPFNAEKYQVLAKKLGVVEIRCAILEAISYRKIQVLMSAEQKTQMMDIRADYIISDKNTQKLSGLARGKQLYKLCAGCHEGNSTLAPHLQSIVNRPIASTNYMYSEALMAKNKERWNTQMLDDFLTAPSKAIPGNRMGFSGLLNAEDRKVLILYLSTLE